MGDETARPPPPERRWRVLPLLAAALFTGLALDAGRRETPTIDEFAHLPAGFAILAHGATDLYAKNPPLGKVLLALPGTLRGDVVVPRPEETPFGWGPWQYGARFMRANAPRYLALFAQARAVSVTFALLAAALLFGWTRELFGERAAALGSALFLLSPTLLGHGHLATLDVACTATVLASVLALRHACRRGGAARFVAAGGVWGVALLVKFTALLLAPVFALAVAWERGRRPGRAAAELLTVGLVALGVVNLGMGFRGSFEPLGSYRFGSDFARAIQQALPAATPVPLPRDYLRGFDAQKRDVEHAEFPAYFHGRWSRDGFWYYELAALALKTPLPFLVLLGLCPLVLWRYPLPRRELAWLLVPIAVLGFLLTALNQLNVGIRYLLPLYPFAFVLTAAVWALPGRAVAAAGLASVALYAGTALRTHPSHLAWFNALAGGSEGGHRWLLDSNLDWGQDLYRLPAALDALDVHEPVGLLYFGHVDPALYGIRFRLLPRQPQPGVYAVSVSYLEGFAYPAPAPDGRTAAVGPDRARWLRDVEPTLRLGSIWVFDLRATPPASPPR